MFIAFLCNFLKKESHKRGALSNFLFLLGKILTPNVIFLEEYPKKLYPTIDEVCMAKIATQLLP